MKSILLLTCFMVFSVTSFSQQTKHSKPLTQEDYLQKSRNQRTLGYIFLGAGTVAFSVPVIIYASDPYFDAADINSAVGPLSILVGAAMVVTSFPLFISSGIKKRKGMNLSFKNETIPYIQNGSYLTKGVPSLTLKIGL